MFISKKDDPLKKHEEAVDELRHERRKHEIENIQNRVDNFNATHANHVRIFQVPNALTFDEFKDSHVFPYRSANKLKSIYNNFDQANLLNRMSTADVNKLTNHYNAYKVKKNKSE